MSEFVFNLNGSLLSPENRALLTAGATKFESSLNSRVPDDQLTYTGKDTIVWDRVNGERLRRGLPGLTELGYPRPPDDPVTGTSFNNSSTPAPETFKVSGPPGMTLDQARAIFKQQVDTGSLTGFKVGDALSSATQVSDGLASAQASLSQGLGSIAGKLPAGADLSTITAALGPGAAAAFGQVQSSLTGAIPKISSLTTGAGAAINGALTGLPGQLSTSLAGLSSSLPVSTEALTGQAAQLGSVANTALKTLTDSVKGVPLDGIGIANFTKQLPALGDIGNLSQNDVTGTLAQASKMIGQSFDKISNQLGAGKFGFDASQLEKAGMIKPGTAASFLSLGEGDLTSVLKSPAVWTGKDGVKSLDGLLKNSGLQDKIQQGLMSTGLNDIKQMGIPVDKLTPAALSGVATNAAKSVEGAMAWLKNSPNIPQIPTVPGGDVKAAFDAMATNGAFAVKFTNDKVDSKLKQQEPVTPAVDTVDTATVDAASKRVVGNDKVPDATGTGGNQYTAIVEFSQFVENTTAGFQSLKQKISAVNSRYQAITQDQWNVLNSEAVALRATVRARIENLNSMALKDVETIPSGNQTWGQRNALRVYNYTLDALEAMTTLSEEIRQLIKELANMIYSSAILRSTASS